MARRSSISSFRIGVNEIPLPSGAVIVALAVLVVFAAALAYLGGWQFGEPPTRAYPTLTEQALRYNRTPSDSGDEILLLGSSLMRLGVVEDALSKDLDRPHLRVMNLAMDGAGPWEDLRLLARLHRSTTAGARLAVIEVNRASFDARLTANEYGEAKVALASYTGSISLSRLAAMVRFEAFPPRQDITYWVQEFRYGFLASAAPSMVATPTAPPRVLWSVDAETQRRAVRAMTPAVAGKALLGWRLSSDKVMALRELVRELHARKFSVILLQTPVHSAYLEYWGQGPDGSDDAATWRSKVLDRASTGADAVLALDDAKAMDATDAVFIDYGHMTRDGALIQTALLAHFIQKTRMLALSPALASGPASSAQPAGSSRTRN